MIVLELPDNKYGKIMEAVTIIKEKIECIEDMFGEDVIAHRNFKRRPAEDDEEYESMKHRYGARMAMRRY